MASFLLGIILIAAVPEPCIHFFAEFAFAGIQLSLLSLLFAAILPISWIPIYWIAESKKRPIRFYHFLPSLPSSFIIVWTALIMAAQRASAPILAWLPGAKNWPWALTPLDFAFYTSAGLAAIVALYIFYKSYSEVENFPWHTFWVLCIQVAICGACRFVCILTISRFFN